MATEKTLKTRVKMKHGKESEWALATKFTPLIGEIIVYDVDNNHTSPRFKVGDGLTNVNNLKFVNQDELAKITTLGNELLAVKNGYVPNTRTINSKPLSANISLTASDVGAAASSHTHSYLPLSGGTVTGTLTVNKELYSNAAVISKRNSSPQLILQNANGAQLGSIYSGTSDGSYSDVLISVNSSSSDVAYFGFAKNGQFTAPNNIYSKGTLVSQTNSYPQLALQNASGAPLGTLAANTTSGAYSDIILQVYSDASTYRTFSFQRNGTFEVQGTTVSYYLMTKANGYPCLYFSNNTGKTLAQLVIPTADGSYNGLAVNVFSDANTKVQYMFKSTGIFQAPSWVEGSSLRTKTNNYPELSINNANGTILAELFANTTSGAYSDTILKVCKDASSASYFFFGKDGTFRADAGITTTGNYISIKNNSYPQLTFSNASGADLGKFFVSTTDGSYASAKIRAYSSASTYYDFQFRGNGTFNCETIGTYSIYIGGEDLVQLSQNDNKGSGYVSIGNTNFGDWRIISVADDGRLLIDYTNPIYALGSSVIYSSSQPSSPSTGMIWLKPV